jgi:DNA replication protein DnaC
MKIQEQMTQLRLAGMKTLYSSLSETRQLQNLNLDEGLELLLQAETENRNTRRTERLTQKARFRYKASLSEINYLENRNLDKNLIASLSDCSFINKGQSIIITGATGCGKSFLASALGQQACILGYKVLYSSLSKLFSQLKISRLEGTLAKITENIAKQQLLIIDDFGITGLDQQQAIDLMEIIEDRHGRHSTIIASQIPIAAWYDMIPDSTIADAILDRLIHTATRVELKGDSLRKIK